MSKYPVLYTEYGIAKGSQYPLVRGVNVNLNAIWEDESMTLTQRALAFDRVGREVRAILPPLCMITYENNEPTHASDDFDGNYDELAAELNDWVEYAVRMA